MIKQILIYTRPWEVTFHIELGKALSENYPEAKLRFVTFFSDVHKLLIKEGFDSVLFTEKLNKIKYLQDVSRIDKELYTNLGLNLNLLAGMERFLPKNKTEAEAFIIKHTMVLDELIIENTLSISTMYDHFVYLLAGLLANIRNGYHFAFVMSGMPANRVIALKTPWETWQNNNTVELAFNLLEDSISKMNKPAVNRIGYMNLDWKIPFYKRITKTIKEYITASSDFKKGNYFTKTPINRIKANLKARLQIFSLSGFAFDIKTEEELENVKKNYIYCPLHMEPEATILMYSPWLRDQIEMCRLISQALPSKTLLLVKENPKMKNIRNKMYYKKLKEIPNVVLVGSNVESLKLINNSIGVVTLAGTASLEATVLGKNSMCFGMPPFSMLIPFSNYASNFYLNDLNTVFIEWSNSSKLSVDFNKWHKWINGTFEGNMVQQKNNLEKTIEIEPNKSTIKNTVEYIHNVIYK